VVIYLKYQLQSPISVYEMMQILGISVFAKTPMNELLAKIQIKKMLKNILSYLISTNIRSSLIYPNKY